MKKKTVGLIASASIATSGVVAHLLKKKAEKTSYSASLMEPIEKREQGFYEKYVKRGLDVACAAGALVCFSPIYLGTAALVRLKLGSPVLFTQDRPGMIGTDGKETIFKMYKFRTMTDETDENGNLLPDDARLTKFGAWLRSTSLDELPEAINILNGTMSVIGPRPQLVRDLTFMTKVQRKRHTAKPGLSGLAQINGRNSIDWNTKLEWDVKYINSINFIDDCKIVIKTIEKAFIEKEGIREDGRTTAEDYGDYLLRKGLIDFNVYQNNQLVAERTIKHNDQKKKILIVASVISFIEWFNKENIEYLLSEGYEVHIASNLDYMDDTDEDRTKEYIVTLIEKGIVLHNISFERNPINTKNIKTYFDLKKLIDQHNYSIVHCHTPTASIITRLAAKDARKRGTIVMYTCHGFHFHKTAPKKNWILYYPIEKQMSKYCDYLITINKEDYSIANTFYAKEVRYIPGVGVDINRILDTSVNREQYKESIGLPSDCIMILSVGELIERKNHKVIIKALAKLKRKDIFYVVCGKGPLKKELENLANELDIGNNVVFLGFRSDIPELCKTADISAFPSRIEGLGLAGIEAMAAGVPLVSSNVHGIMDYVVNGKTGFALDPNDIDGFSAAIELLANNKQLRENMHDACVEASKPFEIHNALQEMWKIYDEVLEQ